eukprot:scaffold18900_cov74-Phaeocystis_antarctica.AAC.1
MSRSCCNYEAVNIYKQESRQSMRHPSYVLVEKALRLATQTVCVARCGRHRESGEGACTRAERIEWVLTAGARRQGGRARWPGLNLKYSEGSKRRRVLPKKRVKTADASSCALSLSAGDTATRIGGKLHVDTLIALALNYKPFCGAPSSQ